MATETITDKSEIVYRMTQDRIALPEAIVFVYGAGAWARWGKE